MKNKYLLRFILFLLGCVVLLTGCKYDAADSVYQPQAPPVQPVITGVTPADSAGPGYNTITILGHDFSTSVVNTNHLYFDKYVAEIVGVTSTSITVRRPNYVSSTSTISISSPDAWWASKYGPYNIVSVLSSYGGVPKRDSVDRIPLTAIVVDNAENVYVTRKDSKGIFRINTNGTTDSLLRSFNSLTDAVIGPDNRLYMLSNATQIRVIALSAGATYATWATGSKAVTRGDFDANGYFYAGGNKNWFEIVSPGSGSSHTYTYDQTTYINDTILAIRTNASKVYVAAKSSTTGAIKIYSHDVSVAGTLGAQQLFFDWSASPFASANVTSLSFSSDGTMYVGTDGASNTLVAISLQGGDYFYKSILPGYCTQLAWGASTSLYMIGGNGSSGADWKIYKIAMGATKGTR